MPKGGYQIIDLKSISLSSNPVTIPGLYEKIESSIKPLMLQNIVIDSAEQKMQYAPIYSLSGSFVIVLTATAGKNIRYLLVKDDDSVTYTSGSLASAAAGYPVEEGPSASM